MRSIVLTGVVLAVLTTDALASVEISSAPTSNMQCSAGVCAPSAKKAVLNATDLANMLAASDVKVVTGSGAVTITVASSFSWTSASRLTLDARQNVSFAAPVTVAGPGGLTIVYNDGGTNGDLIFFPGAKVDFWDLSSSFMIGGNDYTLVGSIATLAADVENAPSGFYALAADYDATGDTSWPIPEFSGVFEGVGHKISNMTLSGAPSGSKMRPRRKFGLFASVSGGISDLNFVHVVMSQNPPDKSFYGALAGDLTGFAHRVTADVNITMQRAPCDIGGLVGENEGVIDNSSTTGVIGGCREEGGLVGFNTVHGSLNSSSSSVAVTGGGKVSHVGGAVGTNFGKIAQSSATGTISGAHAGGLAGQNFCSLSIEQSFATGDVTGRIDAGGLVGSSNSGIEDSYATGAVHGGRSASAGGLVGSANTTSPCNSAIVRSYSTAAVSGHGLLGGVIGKDNTSTNGNDDAYWDLDTSGITNFAQGAGNIANDGGLTGLTDTQLKSRLPEGFASSTWGLNHNIDSGYPYLLANPPQ